MPHTSRQGWLARYDCFHANPMTNDPSENLWPLTGRSGKASLRAVASEIVAHFRASIVRVADPLSLQQIDAVLSGRKLSYLDLDARPAAYENVGRPGRWPRSYSDPLLDRSRFEQIVLHTMARDKLRIKGELYTPTGMRGWSRIAFRRDSDGRRMTLSLAELVPHLDDWR
jgi:hypothetical protein